MKTCKHTAAFTRLELLALAAVLGFLVLLLLMPLLATTHKRTPGMQCIRHLKHIGFAFRIYASDNSDRFPALSLTNQQTLASLTPATHFLLLTNELSTPKLLHCPADSTRRPADSFSQLHSTNISYFTSLSANSARPQDFLAGDRNFTINGTQPAPAKVIVPPDDKLGWTSDLHNNQGNILMADGSVQQFNGAQLQKAFQDAKGTNLLLFP